MIALAVPPRPPLQPLALSGQAERKSRPGSLWSKHLGSARRAYKAHQSAALSRPAAARSAPSTAQGGLGQGIPGLVLSVPRMKATPRAGRLCPPEAGGGALPRWTLDRPGPPCGLRAASRDCTALAALSAPVPSSDRLQFPQPGSPSDRGGLRACPWSSPKLQGPPQSEPLGATDPQAPVSCPSPPLEPLKNSLQSPPALWSALLKTQPSQTQVCTRAAQRWGSCGQTASPLCLL